MHCTKVEQVGLTGFGNTPKLPLQASVKRFGMSFHFQNVVIFRNVSSFSKCERFCQLFFPLQFCFSEKGKKNSRNQ